MNNSQIIKAAKKEIFDTMADMWSEIRNNEGQQPMSRAKTSLIIKVCELHHQLQDTLKELSASYAELDGTLVMTVDRASDNPYDGGTLLLKTDASGRMYGYEDVRKWN